MNSLDTVYTILGLYLIMVVSCATTSFLGAIPLQNSSPKELPRFGHFGGYMIITALLASLLRKCRVVTLHNKDVCSCTHFYLSDAGKFIIEVLNSTYFFPG